MNALVIGGAHSVWRDIYRVESVVGPWDGLVIGVNDIGTLLPRLDAWATLHPEKLPQWKREREARGYTIPPTWSNNYATDYTIAHWANGSSGLLGVGVAFAMGAEEIILCGVRMDRQRNHFREEKGWQQHDRYRRGWLQKLDVMRGKVYSVSGWTREILGPPPFLAGRT